MYHLQEVVFYSVLYLFMHAWKSQFVGPYGSPQLLLDVFVHTAEIINKHNSCICRSNDFLLLCHHNLTFSTIIFLLFS